MITSFKSETCGRAVARTIYMYSSNPAAVKQLPHHDGCNASPKIGDITFPQADIEEAIGLGLGPLAGAV